MAAPQTIPHRNVRTRRISFAYPPASLDRHYVNGDLVMSHIVSVLSALFPPGEDFFVRAVKRYADEVTDAELKQQVAGFIGQEVTHGREHRELNKRLQEMGYPTHRVSRMAKAGLLRNERLLPPKVQLAMTAALEHYTATLAETLLTDPRAQALLGDTEVRSMLLWHALEESEHKSVAFDVFQQAIGDEKLRIRMMRFTTFAFLFAVLGHTALSLLGDKATYNPRRLARSVAELRHSPFLSRRVIARLRDYNRVGFHPDDHDATELLERWRVELFGEQGTLADHMK
jgi:predicted metal-dependent hydrolase